jgi:hypothetical protein
MTRAGTVRHIALQSLHFGDSKIITGTFIYHQLRLLGRAALGDCLVRRCRTQMLPVGVVLATFSLVDRLAGGCWGLTREPASVNVFVSGDLCDVKIA